MKMLPDFTKYAELSIDVKMLPDKKVSLANKDDVIFVEESRTV